MARESPPPNSLALSFSIDIHNLDLVRGGNLRTGQVAVDIVQEDATGKLIQKWGRKFSLRLTDAQYTAFLNSGMPFHQDVILGAGVTTIRVLVEDLGTGEFGSLIIPVSTIL